MSAQAQQALGPELSRRWLDFMLRHQVVGLFDEPITLASGKRSHWYVNWREVAADVFLLDQVTDLLIESLVVLGLSPDLLYGVPEGASKLALLAQFKWARQAENYGPGSHVLAMGRGKPKAHGAPQDRLFLGTPRGRVLVLEDVTTTGSSLLDTVDQLQAQGIEVCGALSLTDRQLVDASEESISDKLAQRDVPFFAMTTAAQLLPAVVVALRPSDDVHAALLEECPCLSASASKEEAL